MQILTTSTFGLLLAYHRSTNCNAGASSVLLMSEAQWAKCLCDDTHGQQWLELDSLLSTTIFACFTTTSKHVQILSSRLARTDSWSSGRAIWDMLKDAANPTSGPRKQEREANIKSKNYFTDKMDATATEVALERLLTDWMGTTEARTGDPILFMKYLSPNLPNTIAAKRDDWLNTVFEREATHRFLPWNFRDFSEIVGVALRNASPIREAHNHEAFAAWARQQGTTG